MNNGARPASRGGYLSHQTWEYLKLERGPIHLGHSALAGLSQTVGVVFTFVILHAHIVIYDSTQYRNGLVSAMITGRKFYRKDDTVQDTWLG